MPKKIFNQKIINVSSKKLAEIELAAGSSLKRLFFYGNLTFWSFFLTLISLFAAAVAYSALPEKIPLFYSRPWGEEQLAIKSYLFLLPGLSVCFSLINILIAKIVSQKEKNFLITMLAFFSFFCSFLSLITLIKVIFLII